MIANHDPHHTLCPHIWLYPLNKSNEERSRKFEISSLAKLFPSTPCRRPWIYITYRFESVPQSGISEGICYFFNISDASIGSLWDCSIRRLYKQDPSGEMIDYNQVWYSLGEVGSFVSEINLENSTFGMRTMEKISIKREGTRTFGRRETGCAGSSCEIKRTNVWANSCQVEVKTRRSGTAEIRSTIGRESRWRSVG